LPTKQKTAPFTHLVITVHHIIASILRRGRTDLVYILEGLFSWNI